MIAIAGVVISLIILFIFPLSAITVIGCIILSFWNVGFLIGLIVRVITATIWE